MTGKVPPLACHAQTSLQGSYLSNIGIGSEIQGNPNGEQPGTIPTMAEGPMSSLGQGSAVNPREHACQCQTTLLRLAITRLHEQWPMGGKPPVVHSHPEVSPGMEAHWE